jgi:uncharacterized protein
VIALKLNVAPLQDQKTAHLHHDVSLVIDPPEGVAFTGPFTGEIDAYGTEDEIYVQVALAGSARLECARCLAPVAVPIKVKFTEEFRPGTPNDAGEQEEDDEGHAFTRYAGEEVDLTEPIRQQVLLELPMKVLCRTDCAGLCPICGGNKNEQACTCERSEVDPRLAVLKKLLRPDQNSN